jgi:GNAT superfamily N-acetyltransferase
VERVRPPGYPSEYEVELVLSDGREVSARPILPSDAAELEAAFRTADSATLWMRFLGPPPELTPELLEWLTDVDYRTRFALVARDSRGHGIGIARWVAQPGGDCAEVAVAVDPMWRRHGLATRLLILLARAAEERGFRAFTATFAGANAPVAELVEAAGAKVETTGGLVQMRMELAELARRGWLPRLEPGQWTGFAAPAGEASDARSVEASVLKGDRGTAEATDEPAAAGGGNAADAQDAGQKREG